ncbi:MAG TPA: hypothetical protein VGF86_13100, partial [Candidatus Tumulicola sp.]
GYDPESMVTMMAHLAVLQDDKSDLLTKYLQDHPDPKNRVAHLMGYPELDPKDVTPAQVLVQASSDEERARYDFAALRLGEVLQKDPQNAEALLELGESQLALGLTSKSQQTLAEAAQLGSPQTRATANQRIAALRQMEVHRVTLTHPNLPRLQAAVQAGQASQYEASTQIQARAAEGKDQLKAIDTRINSLQYEIPDFSRINIRRGSKVEAIVKNLTLMSRSVDSSMQDARAPIGGVGSLEKNKENGLLKDGADIYTEMLAPFASPPIPADSLAILPSYPQMMTELSLADGDMLRSVDAARASLTMLDQSVGDLDDFLKQLDHVQLGFNGDLSESSYSEIAPLMQRVVGEFNAAASAASQGAQLYNMARTRQLSARITLLGLGTSPQRYSTLQYALQQRFGSNGLDYRTMLRDGLTPGDVTIATIVAADIKSTPEAIVAEAKSSKSTIVDVANAHGMHAWPLEIFAGLMYLDFTDDPSKELRKADGSQAASLSELGL